MEPILQCCQFCDFLVENYIFEIFQNFEKNLNFPFLIWKGNEIVSSLQKRFESYHTSKFKKHKNFATLLKKIFNLQVKLSLGLKNKKTKL